MFGHKENRVLVFWILFTDANEAAAVIGISQDFNSLHFPILFLFGKLFIWKYGPLLISMFSGDSKYDFGFIICACDKKLCPFKDKLRRYFFRLLRKLEILKQFVKKWQRRKFWLFCFYHQLQRTGVVLNCVLGTIWKIFSVWITYKSGTKCVILKFELFILQSLHNANLKGIILFWSFFFVPDVWTL